MKLIHQIKEIGRKFGEKRKTPDKIKNKYIIPKDIKKSLKFRVIDAGDNEAIMAELYALEGPSYPLENYGISFGASPKHVDGLIIVGAISKNMKQAVLNAWERVPNPKILVALGDKAIAGDKKFGEIAGGVKDVFNKQEVIEIPGEVPSAQDIFSYLVSLTK